MEKDELGSWQGTPSEVSHVCQRKGLSFKISFQTELNPLFTSLTHYYVQFPALKPEFLLNLKFCFRQHAGCISHCPKCIPYHFAKIPERKMLLCS